VSLLLAVTCTDAAHARLQQLGPLFLVIGMAGLVVPGRWLAAVSWRRRALLARRPPSDRALRFERRLSRVTFVLIVVTGVGEFVLAQTCVVV
jgi:hypothetical protein